MIRSAIAASLLARSVPRGASFTWSLRSSVPRSSRSSSGSLKPTPAPPQPALSRTSKPCPTRSTPGLLTPASRSPTCRSTGQVRPRPGAAIPALTPAGDTTSSIDSTLTPHPWINGSVERMKRRSKTPPSNATPTTATISSSSASRPTLTPTGSRPSRAHTLRLNRQALDAATAPIQTQFGPAHQEIKPLVTAYPRLSKYRNDC